jgi:hypothetical protein
MSACLNKEKILLLDVHGGLDPQERAAWEKHLQTCDGCLDEKKRTLQLLENIKQTIEMPVFDSKTDDIFTRKLMNKLHTRKITNKKRVKWPSIWLRPFPALAGACIIILVIGIYSLKMLHTTSGNHYQADSNLAEMISTEELEIITNLDMLNDMDSIRKIVELVDYSESNKSRNNSTPNIQGVIRHDDETYV